MPGSELGDSGAQLLANCLWHNDKVEHLQLAGTFCLRTLIPSGQRFTVMIPYVVIPGNKISTRGVEALAEAILNANFTITSLDLTGATMPVASKHMMHALEPFGLY